MLCHANLIYTSFFSLISKIYVSAAHPFWHRRSRRDYSGSHTGKLQGNKKNLLNIISCSSLWVENHMMYTLNKLNALLEVSFVFMLWNDE